MHAAGRDDLELAAERAAGAPEIRERRREDVGSGEAAGALRETAVLDASRVAVVDDSHTRVQGRRDDLLLVRLVEVVRELHDQRLGGGAAIPSQQRRELAGLAAPVVYQLGVRGRDVELDQ